MTTKKIIKKVVKKAIKRKVASAMSTGEMKAFQQKGFHSGLSG